MPRDIASTIVERARRRLTANVTTESTSLAASTSALASNNTIRFTTAPFSIRPNTLIAVGAELMLVLDFNPNGNEATVIRGYLDSEPLVHGNGTEVQIQPRFTSFDGLDAMLFEIDSWAPDLFRVESISLTVNDDDETVEIPFAQRDAIGVIRARRSRPESTSWPEFDFRLQRSSAAISPLTGSGLLVRCTDAGAAPGRFHAGTVVLDLAMPYRSDGISWSTSLTASAGIPTHLLELLDLGIRARLVDDDETGRSDRRGQDQPRRAEETPPGASLTAAQALQRRYDRRRAHEVRRLRDLYRFQAW